MLGLCHDRVHYLFPAVTGIGHQHAGGPIDPSIVVRVPDLESFSTVPHYRRLAEHGGWLEAAELFDDGQRSGNRNAGNDSAEAGFNGRQTFILKQEAYGLQVEKPGDEVTLWATGLGATTTALAEGASDVLYAGLSPNSNSGFRSIGVANGFAGWKSCGHFGSERQAQDGLAIPIRH